MSYIPGMGKAMNDMLASYASGESLDLPNGEFVAKYAKAFKIACIIASVACILTGSLLFFFVKEDREIAIIFLVLGVAMFLLLPTLLSYKCCINKTLMREEYLILFLKRKKEILWSDVKYKKIISGRNRSIKLYDKNKKQLISFDDSNVGFDRILKLSKRAWIFNIK